MVFRSTDRAGLPIETLLPGTGWSETSQWRIARLLWRKLGDLNPEVVLVPGYYTVPGLTSVVWAKLRSRRAILMTETTREDHRRVWWKESVKAGLIRYLFDGAIAGGSRHISYLKELRFPPSKTGRFYDVVDNDYFRNGAAAVQTSLRRADLKLPERYFLYVGRLAEEKNVGALIRAMAQLRRRGSERSLVIVGDGPLRRHLEDQAWRADLHGSVLFAGHKSTAEILPYYAFADCFVLPSSREPWGLVVNEAMAAGLPVVVSNRCGCAGDLVEHGNNGFVFSTEDELTDSLWKVSQLSSRQRELMGQRSGQIISCFSIQHWAEEVFRLVCTMSFTDRKAA